METGKSAFLRLLLVEDSEDDAFLLYSELRDAGHDVEYRRVETRDALQAALREGPWDIVISDHAMPHFSSREALKVLREGDQDIPFIIYSGAISECMAVSAMQEGVQDCVTKGNIGRLLPTIERELESAADRRARKEAEHKIYRLAYFDVLTGLPNRNMFIERVDEKLAGRRAGAALFIDVDHFMRVNQTYPYHVGDSLMRMVAQRLSQAVGPDVLLARLQGDEFAAFASAGKEGAGRIAQDILDALRPTFVHDGLEFFLTATVGICHAPEHARDAVTLLSRAECAMSVAKKACRSSFRSYSCEIGDATARKVEMESALRYAVERDELYLNYQPLVDVQSGAVVGMEALVRWHNPQVGQVSPDQFIPIADETGLIVEIGEWVLRKACHQAVSWLRRRKRALTISVNVSAVQFAQPSLLNQVAQVLDETGLPAGLLELEITESVLMQDAEATTETLRALKDMGVRISVDDFGTGYSSLSYLRRFPIDTIKIDKSFIRDVTTGDDARAIVGAITALARRLRLTTHAEGVETPAQLEFLRHADCDRVQGYLFAKPLSAQAAEEFLVTAQGLAVAA